MRRGSTLGPAAQPGPGTQAAVTNRSKGMQRRYYHYHHTGRWPAAARAGAVRL